MSEELEAESTAARMAGVLRSQLNGDLSDVENAAARARFVNALAARPARVRTGRWLIAGGGLVALGGLTALVFALARPVTFTVAGVVPDSTTAWVAATEPTSIAFSDGSRVLLDTGTRGRVTHNGWRGAAIEVGDGRAHLDLRPRRYGQWTVEAGPFAVRVAGMRFGVAWASKEGRLEVAMDEGTGQVQGPLLDDGLTLVKGQRLLVDLAGKQTRIERMGPIAESHKATAGAEVESARSAAPAEEPVAAPRLAPKSDGDRHWAERVAAGEFQAVVADARRIGVPRVLQHESAANVAALADAGRYVGDLALAERALLAQRSRWKGSPRAVMAAFLLGRIDEDRGHPAAAVAWYERYLSEAPQGTFAGEAWGRKMMALRRDPKGVAAARAYLQRFPSGPYADVARAILSGE